MLSMPTVKQKIKLMPKCFKFILGVLLKNFI